ncbi:MAG: glycosyltransferase family 87 protein, partial [Pseudomonadota bacterium]
GGLLPNGSPFGSDFVSFWTAAREALAGRPDVPYDRSLFEPLQASLFPTSGYFAFFYPPHFLVYMMPFGHLSFYAALIVWMVLSFGFAVFVLAKITALPKEVFVLALAFPAAFLTIAHGQNAFVSAGLFGGALFLLPSRPVIAGILFGLLTYKPQLGLLIPFVLVAGGYWRSIIAAGATLFVLIVVSTLVLGADIWSIFFAQSHYAVETLRHGIVAWEKMISSYAALRVLGFSDLTANIVHYSIALGVAVFALVVWMPRNHILFPIKAAVLLCASLIVTPFSLNYDLFILAPAMAFFVSFGLKGEFLSYEKTILAIVYMSPIIVLWFMPMGISTAPLFILLFFGMLVRRAMHEMGLYEISLNPQST